MRSDGTKRDVIDMDETEVDLVEIGNLADASAVALLSEYGADPFGPARPPALAIEAEWRS